MSVPAEPGSVGVTLRGDVGSGAGAYAQRKIANALSVASGPVLHAHVVLDWRQDPAVECPATAEATVDVDGSTVRAKSAAPTMHEAVDAMDYRLRRQLVQLEERTRTRRRWTARDSVWRHGDPPRRPLPYFPRPVESREVVRRKSFASQPMTVDEAAYEMDLLGHDFFLYADLHTGAALVHRLPDGGYAVRTATAAEAGTEPVASVTYEPAPSRLTEAEARLRLESHHEPHVFYLDSETGQGRVLYLRYDGHYGLITLEE